MGKPDRDKQGKAAYSAPTLTIYGGVKKLTAAGTGISNEGSGSDVLKKP